MTEVENNNKNLIEDQLILQLVTDFKSKFSIDEQTKDYLLFKVSQKETLLLTLLNKDSISNIKYDYKIYLEPQENCIILKFDGGLIQATDKKITKENAKKILYSFEYADQQVNPCFMLFGLLEEERFVKGDLARWERKDGKFVENGKQIEKTRKNLSKNKTLNSKNVFSFRRHHE